jgi:hypothetical protein
MPCTAEEIAMYGNTYSGAAAPTPSEPAGTAEGSGSEGGDDDLFRQMVGGGAGAAPSAAPSSEDDLFREMVGAGAAGRAGSVEKAPPQGATNDDELFRQMVGAGTDGGH